MARRAQKVVASKERSKNVPRSKDAKVALENKSVSYQDYLLDSLKDPEEAAGYLNAAFEGGDANVFLLALRNVIHAQGGVSALAEKTKKSRTSLYKSLSENGNPHLKNTSELLRAMGMRFSIIRNGERPSH